MELKTLKERYQTPQIEIVDIEVEKGFAASRTLTNNNPGWAQDGFQEQSW